MPVAATIAPRAATVSPTMSQDARSEFDDLGEEEVRRRLAGHVWSASKERLARQWLELREWSTSSADAKQTLAMAKEANDLARSGNTIATVALIMSLIAIAVAVLGIFLKR